MRAWQAGLPAGLTASTLLGLVYLEQRLGCWASPLLYGTAPFALHLTPFCHREVFDLMLRLPASYRAQKRLPDDLIAASWPELGRVPFNEYPQGLRRWTDPGGSPGRLLRRVYLAPAERG
jgi:hypothetical protein